jgi:hypothetical protein
VLPGFALRTRAWDESGEGMFKIAPKDTINARHVHDPLAFYAINPGNCETLENAPFPLPFVRRSNRRTCDDCTLESQSAHNNQYIPRRWYSPSKTPNPTHSNRSQAAFRTSPHDIRHPTLGGLIEPLGPDFSLAFFNTCVVLTLDHIAYIVRESRYSYSTRTNAATGLSRLRYCIYRGSETIFSCCLFDAVAICAPVNRVYRQWR